MATKREILSFLKRKMEEKKRQIKDEKMETPKEIVNLQQEATKRISEALGSLGLSMKENCIEFTRVMNNEGKHIGDPRHWGFDNGIIEPFVKQFDEGKKERIKTLETEFNKVEEALVMNGLDDATRTLVEAFKTILES